MEEELSDSGDLEQFLQKNDLEKFYHAFKTKGVTKVKHLLLVSEGMLKEELPGMSCFERSRLLASIASYNAKPEQKPAKKPTVSPEAEKVVSFPLPSLTFGRKSLEIGEAQLKKEYPFAFYCSPLNLKHKEVNTWGLNLASYSRHRFTAKKVHEKWVRGEISYRVGLLYKFALVNEVQKETK